MAWDAKKEQAYHIEEERLAKLKRERLVALVEIAKAFTRVGLAVQVPEGATAVIPAVQPRAGTVTAEEIAALAAVIRDALAPFDNGNRPAPEVASKPAPPLDEPGTVYAASLPTWGDGVR